MSPPCWSSAALEMIRPPMSDSFESTVPSGAESTSRTVRASGASSAATPRPRLASGRDDPCGNVGSSGSNWRPRLASTSAEVRVVPSWKVTPSRRVKV
jgi:hypothetical protein